MDKAEEDALGFETLAIRIGHTQTQERENSEPLFLTSSYTFETAAQAAACFAGEIPGNIYSRFTNPTVKAFEQRLAALEGAERCVATASGMAAIMSTCLALLRAGDHIVCSRSVFGSIPVLLEKYFGKFGVETSFVDLTNLNEWQRAIRPSTKLFFIETPSNPLCEVGDIQALADLAHSHAVLLVVDNCFCTPALQQPMRLGADLVIHSATKYLDGQGRCVGGAVAGGEALMQEIFTFLRTGGPCLSPFNAWVLLKGLETLKLRMDAHSASALQLASWLQQQTKVEQVFYVGLPDHPQHQLATRQQSGFGGVVSFKVKGEQAAAWRFYDATRLISKTANLGDAKSTITHPASTTHARLSPEARAAAGISDNLIRIAVGLESVQDLQVDLQRGIDAL